MDEHQAGLELLRRIEENQLKALAMQAEQITLIKTQIAQTEARVQESIELQKVAVARQAKALYFLVPIILVVVVYFVYLISRLWA